MSRQYQIRRLSIADSQDVQDCYDSQPKLMLVEKSSDEPPYAGTFQNLLFSGCVSFGAFDGATLKAFCVLWPWPNLPASTIVLAVNRPDGAIYNPERTGFRAALDAGLAHVEADARTSVYFARSAKRQWNNRATTRRLGRLAEYQARPVETIAGGCLSRFQDFNRFILGGRAIRSDAVIIHATAPHIGEF